MCCKTFGCLSCYMNFLQNIDAYICFFDAAVSYYIFTDTHFLVSFPEIISFPLLKTDLFEIDIATFAYG